MLIINIDASPNIEVYDTIFGACRFDEIERKTHTVIIANIINV